MMPMEERLAHVEGLMAGHAQLLIGLRTAVTNLEVRVDRRFDQMDGRLTAIEQKVDTKVDALDQKLDGRFRWMMSMMVALVGTMVTLVGAVIAVVLTR